MSMQDIIFSGRPEKLKFAELSNSMPVQGVQAPPPGSAGTAGGEYQPPTQVSLYILPVLHALSGGGVYIENEHDIPAALLLRWPRIYLQAW